MSIRAAGLLALLAAVVVAGSSATAAPQAPRPGKGKPSKVANVVERFTAAVGRARAAGRSAAPLSNTVLHARQNGGIELLFHASGQLRGQERSDLIRLGASIVTVASMAPGRAHPGGGLVQAWVPHNRVAAAASLDWVVAVTPPGYSQPDTHPTNPINSQGVAFHNANVVQNPRLINGTGVNVGVISDGVSNLATSQAQNELPAINNLDTGSGDEGTAMLEIVHDMAPGAGLLFDGTGGGVANHVNALNNLVANGANVITEDIPFDAEPAFQVGFAAQTAENIAAAGVPVHSSAGNQALRHAARVAAVGTGAGPDGTNFGSTPSGCTYSPSNVVDIGPGAGTAFDVTLGNGGGSFTLQWSEPRAIFPTAGQGGFTDLDLFVMDAGLTQCLSESIGVQSFGQGDTLEIATFGTGMGGTNVKVIVEVFGAFGALAAPTIDLRGRGWTAVDTPTRAGSLNPDSNYVGQATSAAALDAQNAGAIEGFSSGGPVQLITTTQCSTGASGLPCDGGSGHGSPQAGANITATGPTWAAADNVNVSGVGGFGSPFTGTSAAAPHAAGCDALLRDALNNAAAATATTNARLIATAADVAPAGTDNTTGVGRLDCLQAVNNPPNADAGGPYGPTPEGTTVTLTAAGSSDPDVGDAIASYSWDLNNDGIFGDATGVTAAFNAVDNGVYTVRVRVTDNAGVTDDDSSTVTVTNVPPTLGAITAPTLPVQIGTPITASANFTDPGVQDTFTAVWSWGDTQTTTIPLGAGSTSTSAQHTYTSADLYTITLTVTDDDGGSDSETFQFVIVFDPTKTLSVNAKITSPAGAYVANPSKTGDAFSSAGARYKNGVPSGGTSFQFNAAPFTFNATSYKYLVVTTTGRGYLQGAGVVNGSSGYSFLLSVVDAVSGDKYRLKVWNTVTNAVVYDSQLPHGQLDNAAANVSLLVGSVVLG